MEMDLQTILNLRPRVVIIDELLCTNVVGCRMKRDKQDTSLIYWIQVSIYSCQYSTFRSLHDILKITGIDGWTDTWWILNLADEVVNIDLTADELINQLKKAKSISRGKNRPHWPIFFRRTFAPTARIGFKKWPPIRERKSKIKYQLVGSRHEIFFICISSNAVVAKTIIRKTTISQLLSQSLVLF